MTHINLLPWRESLRQEQKKQYLTGLGLLAALVVMLFWFIGQGIDHLVNNQNTRNSYLENEIAILDAQIAKIKTIRESKQAIEQRMALIEQLQASRNIAPKILDELARIVPSGLSFRSISRKGDRLEVLGISESNNRLAEFMRRLQNSRVFSNGELSSIIADTTASDAVSEFKINFTTSPALSTEINKVAGEATQ